MKVKSEDEARESLLSMVTSAVIRLARRCVMRCGESATEAAQPQNLRPVGKRGKAKCNRTHLTSSHHISLGRALCHSRRHPIPRTTNSLQRDYRLLDHIAEEYTASQPATAAVGRLAER